MIARIVLRLAPCVVVTVAMAGGGAAAAVQSAGTGTIKGHVRLTGTLPGNRVFRMAADPMCAALNRGKQLVQETVVANLKGDLANVFVKLQGSFPHTPPPATPVTIGQRGCLYSPRVVGVRAGQTLQIRNDDALLHNLHSSSAIKDNGFNISQPIAGMVNQFHLKEEADMIRLRCDVHGWMTSFIGVVSHPYFAVSNQLGTFDIARVPPGSYTIQAWHERYGPITHTVRVKAGATTTVDFAYMEQGR